MNLSPQLSKIIVFFYFWFPLTALTNLAVISLNRMHATIRPLKHRLIKNWVSGVTIAGVWVLATIFSSAILILNNYGKERSYHFYVWQSYCCLSLFVICVSYSCIVLKFLCGAHPPHHGAASRQRKLTITLFIMTIVSLLMWLPYAVATFLYFQSSLKFLSLQESFRLEYSLKILYFMNSLVNPIVYAIRMPEFRKALLLLFKCQQRRNNNIIPLHAL